MTDENIKDLKNRLERMKQYNDTYIKERNKQIVTDTNGKIVNYLHSCYITEFYENHDKSIVSMQIDFNDYLKRLLNDLEKFLIK